MFDPDGVNNDQWADIVARKFAGFSTFSENFAAAVGQTVDEELSISSSLDVEKDFVNPFTNPAEFADSLHPLIDDPALRMQTEKVKLLMDEGKISPDLKDRFSTRKPRSGTVVDYEALAMEANKFLSDEDKIPTMEEYNARRNEILAQRRGVAQDIFSRSDGYGATGQFLGGMTAGMALDPVSVATAPLAAPLLGVSSVSKAWYAINTGIRAAAFNAGLQGTIEPFVHSWKEEIGAEYTVQDSLFNMGAAGLLGGSMQGVGSYIGMSLRGSSFVNKDYDSLYTDLRNLGLSDAEASPIAQHIYEANNALDPKANVEDAIKESEARQEAMRRGEPNPDYEPEFDARESTEVNLTPDDIDAIAADAARDTADVRYEEVEVDPIDAMYDEIPDDVVYILENGEEVSIKQSTLVYDEKLSALDNTLTCLGG